MKRNWRDISRRQLPTWLSIADGGDYSGADCSEAQVPCAIGRFVISVPRQTFRAIIENVPANRIGHVMPPYHRSQEG